MQFWNHIIHTALLGTDKKQVGPEELGPDLQVIAGQIHQQGGSREDQFLQIAAVAFNYHQCGRMPFHKEGVSLSKAPAEAKAYCSPAAVQVLKDILDLENNALLGLWLRLCQARQQLVIPDLLPALLQLGVTQKALRPAITDCGGRRAQWLAGFNPDWGFAGGGTKARVDEQATAGGIPEGGAGTESTLGVGAGNGAGTDGAAAMGGSGVEMGPEPEAGSMGGADPDKELWQTGSPEQRRQLLQQIRQANPDKAREWLQQIWIQEDANSRAELLKQLSLRLGENDLPFLEGLLTDKSKKVKEEAMALLKRIPESSFVQSYWNVLRRTISLKKEKALLGLVNKAALRMALPAEIDESIFKSGIGKLSHLKTVSDEQYIVAQLIVATPPYLWEKHFELRPREIVALFDKTKETAPLTEALAVATGRWGSKDWAPVFIGDESRFYPDLLPLLPAPDREKYLLQHFTAVPDAVISWLTNSDGEWSLALTRTFFTYAAKNPTTFNRGFFNQHIHSIPVVIREEIEKFRAPDGYLQTTWAHTTDHLSKLLLVKQRTLKAFNE